MKNKRLIEKLNDVINKYIDNCNDTEWERLLSEYSINNQENYMGEVRNNLIEAIIESNRDKNNKELNEIIAKYSKYYHKNIELLSL